MRRHRRVSGDVLLWLRLRAGWSLVEMAERLSSHGARVATGSGVSRLEERGTSLEKTLQAYEKSCKCTVAKMHRIERLVSDLGKTLPEITSVIGVRRPGIGHPGRMWANRPKPPIN